MESLAGHGRSLRLGRLAPAGLICLSLVVNVVPTVLSGLPRPDVHDEFSYLLAADTFLRGRLTNPTHPFWEHFESIHIIHRPSYQSKFPPGQGLILAAGKAMSGQPIVGVWLTSALACAAVWWMLRAFVPPAWAGLGGTLAAIHPVTIRWSHSYWGGSLAMLGGALLIGGMQRFVHRRRPQDAATLGLGMSILALSRPFEGLVLACFALGRIVLGTLWGGPRGSLPTAAKLCFPFAAVLVPSLGAMGYYNSRVTGSFLRLPYLEHADQYACAPLFLWQQPKPLPAYRHAAIRDFHVRYELKSFESQRSRGAFLAASVSKLRRLAGSYRLVELLPLLLAGMWAASRTPALRTGAILLLGFIPFLLLTSWIHDHYAAPAFGLYLLLVAGGAREISGWQWRGLPFGRIMVALTALALLIDAATVAARLIRQDLNPHWWANRRAELARSLLQEASRNLVVVEYGPDKDLHEEWVYNDAEIDASPVVWARAINPEADRRLVSYFSNRRVWRLRIDGGHLSLTPWQPPQ